MKRYSITPQQAADWLKVHPDTIRRAIHRGDLRASKPPGTRLLRIAEEDLQAWIEAGSTKDQMPGKRFANL